MQKELIFSSSLSFCLSRLNEDLGQKDNELDEKTQTISRLNEDLGQKENELEEKTQTISRLSKDLEQKENSNIVHKVFSLKFLGNKN